MEATNEIRRVFDDLKRNNDLITADKIKQKYTGEGEIHRMLLEVFNEHNAKLEILLDKDFVKATLTKYRTVRRKTAEYIAWRYKKRTPIWNPSITLLLPISKPHLRQ